MSESNLCASAQTLVRWCMLGSAAVLIALSPRPNAATFTYTNPSCSSFVVSGTSPTQTVTCVTGGGTVPTCTPTANPASPAVGQQTTISANCTNQPTSYVWTGGSCGTSGGATCTVSKGRATTVNFTVTASNGSGTGSTAQLSVTWK